MRSPHAISEQVKAYAEMIELHLFKPATTTRREIDTSMFRWSLPPEGTVLINVDAAIFFSFRRMGIGIMIRNHNGECLVACNELREEVTAPEMAEALAVHRAMSLADEEGFHKLLVVSDCLSVIHRINSVMPDCSHVGVVIQDIKALANNFSDISFSHVYRQVNEAAHILARSAERFSSIVFKNFAPDCIRQTLCNDLL